MKKHPFLAAILVTGAIFLFFAVMVIVVAVAMKRPASISIGPKVGVVEVEGAIVTSNSIIRQLKSFREDNSVKSIVLRVNSPGGGVAPSQEIHTEVLKAVEKKPVVVSMGSVAASGGYYIAAPASRIVANPGTITGSIGVIMEFANLEELFEKIGLKTYIVKSGPYKDLGSPVKPMSENDRKLLQGLISDVHQQFTQAVSEGRNIDHQKVVALADGRIFTGRQALDENLIDELGNVEDAIDTAAKMGGIEGKPRVVYPKQDKPDLLEYLIQESATQVRKVLVSATSGQGAQFLWSGK
ncbi:MAG: signal peptide peptidase SppA [Desulfuromonadales bacterium]